MGMCYINDSVLLWIIFLLFLWLLSQIFFISVIFSTPISCKYTAVWKTLPDVIIAVG